MKKKNKALTVLLAGAGMNLAFGVLYAWSIFGGALAENHGWSSAEASLPYSLAIVFFALLMVPAGRLQDKIGPRWVATLGGLLIGLGCILASFMENSFIGMVIAFGVLAGSGIGLGYASTTPPAVKWFAPEQKGLVTGIVVGGFGLASIYIAPLSKFLLAEFGVFLSFRYLGILFLLITLPLAQLIVNPETPRVSADKKKLPVKDLTTREMLKTKEFYQLWLMFFAGATGGLMIIGHLKTIAKVQLPGEDLGFALVALAAIANAIGRPAAGVISDKLGRGKTMAILYLFQAAILFVFASFNSFTLILFGAMVMYFSYGSMLSIYPSACGDNYGTKNLGLNYGVMFSAWGIGGIVGPMIGGYIKDTTGDYGLAFTIAAVMLIVAAILGFAYKPYAHKEEAQ